MSRNSCCDWLSALTRERVQSCLQVCFYCDSAGAEVTVCRCSRLLLSWDQSVTGSRSLSIMSAYSREILLATSILCSSNGAMQPLQLHRKLLQRCNITDEEFALIIQRCPRFVLVRDPTGGGGERLEDCVVVAKTSLRLCSRYGREECSGAGDCQQLHLCKFFIYGTCRFGKGR